MPVGPSTSLSPTTVFGTSFLPMGFLTLFMLFTAAIAGPTLKKSTSTNVGCRVS
jgi:hypothetical protein